MSIGYRSPWAFWRCPTCESEKEGVLSLVRYAMICTHCGEEDGSSETFRIIEAERARRADVARRVEREEAERRRDEEARKVKISPKEWAE